MDSKSVRLCKEEIEREKITRVEELSSCRREQKRMMFLRMRSHRHMSAGRRGAPAPAKR